MICEVCEKEINECMKIVAQTINDDREQYLLSIIKSQQYALNAFNKYSLMIQDKN